MDTHAVPPCPANRRRQGSACGRPVAFDMERYRQQRDTVERCFQKLENWREIAIRYDTSPQSYAAGLPPGSSPLWG
ncbi:hypothetical protein [Streptomyces sp. A1499]|uniref:hypothetical protein n=1 Tax=Streptomyces sp. A1499 TaxID=2563104 RepID=UPI00144A638B|nr:hypothetical protein [Streptomyces sp. A1499]